MSDNSDTDFRNAAFFLATILWTVCAQMIVNHKFLKIIFNAICVIAIILFILFRSRYKAMPKRYPSMLDEEILARPAQLKMFLISVGLILAVIVMPVWLDLDEILFGQIGNIAVCSFPVLLAFHYYIIAWKIHSKQMKL